MDYKNLFVEFEKGRRLLLPPNAIVSFDMMP